MTAPIVLFHEDYRFLSNFYESPVVIDGQTYASVEHAYQAKKTLDKKWQEKISLANTPGNAKRAGAECPLRKDWESIKLKFMKHCVKEKFMQNEVLRQKLLDTGSVYLEEGNTWGDRFWGTCNGSGANHLGLILMQVRDEIK